MGNPETGGHDHLGYIVSVITPLSSDFLSFLKLHFIDYTIMVVFIFPPLPPPPSTPNSLKQSPHHCSCPWVMHISSLATPFPILYFTAPWLFCNYQFVLLNPLTSSPTPPYLLLSGNHQYTLRVHYSVSVLVCFV